MRGNPTPFEERSLIGKVAWPVEMFVGLVFFGVVAAMPFAGAWELFNGNFGGAWVLALGLVCWATIGVFLQR
jgi:hypothetical protein